MAPKGQDLMESSATSGSGTPAPTTSTTATTIELSPATKQVTETGPIAVTKHEISAVDFFFSNIPNQDMHQNVPLLKSKNVHVKMYKDEPCLVGVYAKTAPDVFVDVQHEIKPESGGVAREAFSTVHPRALVGGRENITVYLSNADKSVVTPLQIIADIVPSTTGKLATLVPFPGRLEPIFSPDVYSYNLRVPAGTHKVSLTFATVNDRDAACSVDGQNFFKAHGKLSFRVPPSFEQNAVSFQCHGADNSTWSSYDLNFVPQLGGDTMLKDVDVLGAPLTAPFNKKKHGVYTADMVRGAATDKGNEIPWTQMKFAKGNHNAVVTVDGVPVDIHDGKSPFIRVPRGEKRRVKVAVTTPENPIAEMYTFDLSRKKGRSGFLDTAAGTSQLADIVGTASLLASSHNAASLMQAFKAAQLVSVLGHQEGNPEMWDDFAAGLHPFNFQPNPCGQLNVHFAGANQTTLSTCERRSVMAPAADFVSTFAEWAIPDQLYSKKLDTSLFDLDPSDETFEWIGGKWQLAQPTPFELNQQPDFANAYKRQLSALTASDRSNLVTQLELVRKGQENATFYLTTLLLVSGMMMGLGLVYGLIWAVYLRGSGETEQSETESVDASLHKSESVSNKAPPSPLRADYPVILHPARFVSFCCDVAFMGFTSGSLGLLFAPVSMFGKVSVLGMDVPVSFLRPLASLVLTTCLGYLIFGSVALAQVAERMVFGSQFCEYHDTHMTHGKAIYCPTWCKSLPWISSLFTMEIPSIAPVRSVTSPDSNVVTFQEDVDAPASPPDGYLKMSQMSAADQQQSTGPAYNGELKAVEVAMNELVYNDSMLNYDGRNADMYRKYPSAQIGSTTFKLQNAYGYPLELRAEIQAQHLTALMQLMDNFVFWLPRKNCQFPAADSWRIFLLHAGRGLYFDWTINRFLMTLMLAIAAYFQSNTIGMTILLVSGFSFAAGLLRVPSYIALAQSKFVRDQKIWDQEEALLQEAQEQAREAEQIWPFSEPGFAERFHSVKEQKDQRKMMGLGGVCKSLNITQSPAARSQGWYIIKEIFFSVIGCDLCIGCAGMAAYFDNMSFAKPISMQSSYEAMTFICVGLVLLNTRSLFSLCLSLGRYLSAVLDDLIYDCVILYNFLMTGNLGARVSHLASNLVKAVTMDPTCNFHYPTPGMSIRRFPVDKVTLVSNELGIAFPSTVGPSTKHLELTVPDHNRLRMYKTLVVNGGLGDSRRKMYNSLPVQVPFYQLFRNDGSPVLNTTDTISRLVATIQIVNHTYRANSAGLPSLKNDDHDSFLSLYANDDFLPTPGKIKVRKDGHTYSVRYDHENHSLVVRGPSINAGRHYTLKTSKRQPEDKEEYVNAQDPRLSISDNSDLTEPSAARGSAQAICDTPGSIRVDVKSSLRPDLYKEIVVQSPDGSQHAVDPTQIKIHYDPICQEMFLRSQDLQASSDPYTIIWSVAPANAPPVDTSATARDNGCIVFPLKGELCPDMTKWMTMRDDNGAVIDIDPKQTDAYQFYFPEKSQSLISTIVSRIASMSSFIAGQESGAGAMEEPIPCTIVQCINPIEKVYRVDPNFHEQYRVLNARIHELRARQNACENSAVLHSLWQTLMRPQEYAAFWSSKGVEIVDEYGMLMDPLNQTQNLPQYHSLFKEIAHGESQLRQELSAMLDARILDLQTQMDKLRVWIRAYNDPALHTAQLDKDLADWSMNPYGEVDNQAAQLTALKSQYEMAADKFVYPCNIPDVLISKRRNISNQFRVWTDIVRSWLLFEEGTDVSTAEGRLRVSSLIKDIMQSLKLTLMSNEVRSLNSYKSVLHYVVGSQSLRGINTNWRPDAMKAHPALVRVWTEKEGTKEADFQKYPSWFPCLLRLTPNAVQMLLPNGDDLVRASPDSDNPWQRTTGVYIPMYAFQKFELQRDVPLPPNEENSKFLESMNVKLICRKNQDVFVDDAYVRRMEDVQIGNEICFSDNGVPARYRVMLGHTVPLNEAHRYPQAEVDPTIGHNEVNVYPLSFRMNPAYADQWDRAIKMANLTQPHGVDFDGHIEDESEDTPVEEVAPVLEPEPEPSDTTSVSVESEPIVQEPSIHSSDMSIPSNPESVSLYTGGFRRGAFEGSGCLRDEAARPVFKGTFVDGRREGHGFATFQSHNLTWQYDGEFNEDEMEGIALITLADSTQVADVRDKLSLISYSGNVPPPTSRVPSDSLSQEAINELFSNAKKRPLFSADKSTFKPDAARRIEALVRAVYKREDGPNTLLHADRFAYSDVLLDEPLLKAAKDHSGPQAQFLKQFLPYVTRWQDRTALLRATQSEGGLWRYVDGSVWEGKTTPDLKPTGPGRFFNWPTQIKFQGTLKDCKPHGAGMLEVGEGADNSTCYYGAFDNGKRVGDATVTTKNVYLKGKFANDVFTWDYQDDKFLLVVDPAYAKERGLVFTRFEGQMARGMPAGKGRVTFASGTVYEGSFVDGKRQGKGKLISSKGEVLFEGIFKDDVPDGLCTYYSLGEGLVFCGDMVNGKRSGYGVLSRKSEEKNQKKVVYEGSWKDDLPHGRGYFECKEGDYEGEWVNGKRHGKGRFRFYEHPLPNGQSRVYEGDWADDKPHGVGKYLSDTAAENVYRVEKGEIVSSSVNEYAPACGKAPEIHQKPTVTSSGFTKTASAYVHWGGKTVTTDKLTAVVNEATESNGWKLYENNTVFIDPTKQVPLQLVRPAPAAPRE